MVNPKLLIAIKKSLGTFKNTHPKFAGLFNSILAGNMIDVGSIIEITVTTSEGKTVKGNMRVQPSDMELFNEFSELAN